MGGEGRLLEAKPVDLDLSGTPVWVAGAPLEEDTAWVVTYNDGRVEAFRLGGGSGEIVPWLTTPHRRLRWGRIARGTDGQYLGVRLYGKIKESPMAVEFGIFVPQGWRMDLVGIEDPYQQYEAMTRVGKVADETGAYDSIWVYDHFHTVPDPTMNTVFEAWTISAGLARDTRNVKIGQMVTCNGYRNPALLAKMASTVDVMSNGRLLCGLGAGWYEHEWLAYGYAFPEIPVRMRMFKEACELIHRMFTEDRPVFDGEFYKIDRPINEPKGISKPHPPIWIGGGGEKVTLKLVARWGDACNVGGGLNTLRHKFDVLKGHCENLDRDYEEITRSTSINVYLLEAGEDPETATKEARGPKSYDEYSREFMVGTSEQIVERLQPMVDAGVDYFITYLPRVAHDPTPVEKLAQEVVPNVG